MQFIRSENPYRNLVIGEIEKKRIFYEDLKKKSWGPRELFNALFKSNISIDEIEAIDGKAVSQLKIDPELAVLYWAFLIRDEKTKEADPLFYSYIKERKTGYWNIPLLFPISGKDYSYFKKYPMTRSLMRDHKGQIIFSFLYFASERRGPSSLTFYEGGIDAIALFFSHFLGEFHGASRKDLEDLIGSSGWNKEKAEDFIRKIEFI